MNIYDDLGMIKCIVGFAATGNFDKPEGVDIAALLDRVDALAEEYRRLAPDWSEAPKGYGWLAIDANGEASWYDKEPKMYSDSWWDESAIAYECTTDLPIGIDWRLCKWQRPEVAQ